jgi:hypothetical protein
MTNDCQTEPGRPRQELGGAQPKELVEDPRRIKAKLER